MNKCIVLLLFTLNFFVVTGQITYEKGYFITNEGVKTECLIENKDWEWCPAEFSYKMTEQSDVLKINTSTLNEFEITGVSKYICREVKIDKSSSEISKMSTTKNPEWSTEKLFLKELVRGRASLYMYVERNLTRFFYSVNDSAINQLVYKNYLHTPDDFGSSMIATNNTFRQQLYVDMNIPGYSMNNMAKIAYHKKELTRYFEKYNARFETIRQPDTQEKAQRDFFKSSILAGVNQRSLVVRNNLQPSASCDFGNFVSPCIGAELEFSLPFTNNKWSILANPIYSFPISRNIIQEKGFTDGSYVNEFQYHSIEVPLGIRYRYNFNRNFNIFINGFYNSAYIGLFRTTIKIKNSYLKTFDKSPESADYLSLGLGVGYNKWSVEIRKFQERDLLVDYSSKSGNYNGLSIYLKYTFINTKTKK